MTTPKAIALSIILFPLLPACGSAVTPNPVPETTDDAGSAGSEAGAAATADALALCPATVSAGYTCCDEHQAGGDSRGLLCLCTETDAGYDCIEAPPACRCASGSCTEATFAMAQCQ